MERLKHRLLLLFAGILLLNPHGISQESLHRESLGKRIDSFLTLGVSNGYSGSVLVALDGEILLAKGYGRADRDLNIPNKPNTVFNIGSVTKQFTAAAILKLADNNKLHTSDRLLKYFPDAPVDKQDITIHHLLTHTSGISPQTGGFRYDAAGKEQFLQEFFQSELMYLPGTKHTYANANYIVLAAVIEIASGQDYESYLRENLWIPFQMEHTGYKNQNFEPGLLAHGYFYNYIDGKWQDWGTTGDHLPSGNDHWYSIGKGDLLSTVEDLYKWHVALEQNRVLRRKTKQLMERAYVPENDESSSFYGYGWAIGKTSKGTKIVTHNGSNGIYFADFIRLVEDDVVVIALSNVILNQASENVAWEIASMITDPEYQAQPVPKNTYELVFEFIRANPPDMAEQLPHYLEEETGTLFNDKAVLNRIGFNQVSEKLDIKWGMALLELNVSLFPEDGNLWDSLGEGYYLIGDRDNAIAGFEKALELRPSRHCYWCDNSEMRLNELSGR